MHELSIAPSILDIVHEHVPEDERTAVRAVRVRVGKLSGVVPESLAFSFTALAAGTPLEHARLVIEDIPVRVHCETCRSEFTTDALLFLCPTCGGAATKMLSGNELYVADIDLEDLPLESP
ncbi:MAG: hydrogenase maturation nickel metallochaperone HypA [Ignavibacteria bacterium]